jgi:hypothetical protein
MYEGASTGKPTDDSWLTMSELIQSGVAPADSKTGGFEPWGVAAAAWVISRSETIATEIALTNEVRL